MKSKLPAIARVLLGLVFLFGSISYFLNLIPPPADMPAPLEAFNEGLAGSGYFFTLLKATELVCGAMLVSGYFVPLALVVLAPVVLNIFLVHLMMAPEGVVLAAVMGLLMIYLAFFAEPYAKAIRPLFAPRP